MTSRCSRTSSCCSKGRLVVPETGELRTRLLKEVHEPITSAHPGKNKTRALLTARYWWPGLSKDVDQFVANCRTCLTTKRPRGKTPGLLQPLPIPERSWQDLVIDYKKMPEDRHGFNSILVMVDQLSKISHTIPCRDTATALDGAKMYYDGPYRTYGLPRTIVSDRGPQFVAEFSRELARLLGINWKLSNSGHSQTAGQAEIMNQYIDQRLRPYVNHYQDNWSEAIPALDCVQASMPHESLGGLSPHEVVRGFPMPLQCDWEARTRHWDNAQDRVSAKQAHDWATTIQGYMEYARKCIREAQARMITQANKHRKDVGLKAGDLVFVLKRSWRTQRPSDKLDHQWTQQHFKILERKGNSCRLDVPDTWRATDTFNVDRLRLYPGDPLPGQANENPAGEVVDDEDEWEVDKIVASRVHYRKLQYQVEWKGWDPDPTWYDAENFRNSCAKLREFHLEHPDQAGPPARIDAWEQAAQDDTFLAPSRDDNKPASTKKGTRMRTSRK
jgi:hypothetical protein